MERATSLFLCNGVVFTSWGIFRYAFTVKITCFVFFADFCFADRFEDEFDSSLRNFRFSAYEEDVREESSYSRFYSVLLLFA